MSRPNTFLKYLGPEDHEQHKLIIWLSYQYPKLKYHHSPNEGKRSAFEQFKFKYLGSDAGFPDLIFPAIETVIEMKVKPNKPTPAQEDWLHFFASIGWTAVVCYSFEDAKKIISERVMWLRNKIINQKYKNELSAQRGILPDVLRKRRDQKWFCHLEQP